MTNMGNLLVGLALRTVFFVAIGRVRMDVEGTNLGNSKVKILIVDDEVDITTTLKRYFVFEGFDVDVTNDPYSALKMIHNNNYLLVISDISMPGMDGIELLRRIKEYNGMIQVVMITGYVTLDNILNCLRLGADDCFLKPIRDLDDLRRAVEDCTVKLTKWRRLMTDIAHNKSGYDV